MWIRIRITQTVRKGYGTVRYFSYLYLLAGSGFPADAGHWTGNHICIVLVWSHTEKCLMQKLKGQSHEIFLLRFFPQSPHSGPIRDVLGPF